jgi:hypothetical protein
MKISALIIGVLSLPVGLAVGFAFGCSAYYEDMPKWLVALLVGVTCWTGTQNFMLSISRWLQ